MNTHPYEVLSQDPELLSFTCMREPGNYSAGVTEGRKRLESWDGGYEHKPKLSADFDFFNLRLPFAEEPASARVGALDGHLVAVEHLETLETAAEAFAVAEEGAAGELPGPPTRIRLRRTSHEVVLDDGVEGRERAAGESRTDGKGSRQVLSESDRLYAKLVKTRQFWQKSSALIPSVFRLARVFDESCKSLFEFQDLSGKHLLVQNYHKSRDTNAETPESFLEGACEEDSESCASKQFLTPF